jgi:hypothetical protein
MSDKFTSMFSEQTQQDAELRKLQYPNRYRANLQWGDDQCNPSGVWLSGCQN